MTKKQAIIAEYEKRSIVESEVNKTKLSEFFDIPHSTLRTILRSKDAIAKAAACEDHKTKSRRRVPKSTNVKQVNECVLAWFRQLLAQKRYQLKST